MKHRVYRRHSPEFKLLVCSQIRSGTVGRREAQATFRLSDNLLHRWLAQYDAGEFGKAGAPPEPAARRDASHIAALESKVERLLKAASAQEARAAGPSPRLRRTPKK
jgi:transposase